MTRFDVNPARLLTGLLDVAVAVGANSCGDTPPSAVTSFAAVVTGGVAAVDTVSELVVDRTASAATRATSSVSEIDAARGADTARVTRWAAAVVVDVERSVLPTRSLREVTREVCDVDVARAAAAGTGESGSYPSAAGSAAERVSATETVPALGVR